PLPTPAPVPPSTQAPWAAAPSAPPPIPTQTLVPPLPPVPASLSCPWDLHVEITGGRARLEVRHEGEVELRVACDRLGLETPDGQIHARGKVEVSGPCVSGTCDDLKLSWQSS